MSVPVSIRTKNPGAMWPGRVASEFGSVDHEDLRDGNKAAIFPTFEQGAAAQFALWASDYAGMTLQEAITKWSGHNSSADYATFLHLKTKLPFDTVITRDFLSGPTGLVFMKAQAEWEAGQPYPMSDDQWRKAQALWVSAPASRVRGHGPAIAAGATVGAAASSAGFSPASVVVIAALVGIVVYITTAKKWPMVLNLARSGFNALRNFLAHLGIFRR